MSSNSRNSRNSSKNDRVAQALGIYRSIAACNERLARGNDVHALTAALMLPCYQAGFRRLALALTPVEANALESALRRIRNTGPAFQERDSSMETAPP
jgi:hypothetical protein